MPNLPYTNALASIRRLSTLLKSSTLKRYMWAKIRKRCNQKKMPTPKTEVGKNQTNNQVLIPRKHFVSRMSSYFPNRWPLSYLNLTKNMKTHIRRQQNKNFKHQDITCFEPALPMKVKFYLEPTIH